MIGLILFTVEPNVAYLREGERLAVTQGHRGMEALLGPDRDWVGKWFDGRTTQSVEFVVSLSPRIMAKWAGFSARREGRDAGEVWSEVSSLAEHPTFVIGLAAYPRMRTFDLFEQIPPDPEPIEDFTVVLVRTTGEEKLQVQSLANIRGRTRRDTDGFDWWSAVRYGLPPQRIGYFGDFHRAYYFASGSDPVEPGEQYELHIYSDRRTRVARFTAPSE
ncbi:MAG: hypothetical protein KF812_07815 [Fimbriimonadaceae bacterium]|nr:hypothetical protein [Fimbriimonadaceae bacterium]